MKRLNIIGNDLKPESIEPADSDGLKEDGDEEGEAGRVVLQQVEDVKPTLSGGKCHVSVHDVLYGGSSAGD